MKTRISILSVVCLISCFLLAGLLTTAAADPNYYADRLSREHRIANDVDEWIERGNATITASPRFEDGVRLSAWANAATDANNYEFAIASAVYLFEIPAGTQSIEILVRYRGEPHHLEIEDYEEPIAGRTWIRNTTRESTRGGYHDENAEETRYGDTFVLRAKNRSERIKIPAAGHVKNGWMELHIVAEGGEQIDVEYLEVSTYRRQPKVKVIQRYTPSYHWRPWHRYTYLYFYDGPIYYATDYDHYLRWSYPIYDHHYLSIRSYYGGYLGRYRTHYAGSYYRGYSPYYGSYPGSYRGTPKVYQRRTRLNRWSAQHETTRRQYSRSRLAANSAQDGRTTIRRNVRQTLENHRRQTPATTERIARQSLILEKRRSLASTSPHRQNNVSRSTYTGDTLNKQRRHAGTATDRTSRYSSSVGSQRTTPLYRRSTSSSAASRRSLSSTTSSDSRSKYRNSSTSSSATRSRTSVTRSTERSRVTRSSSSTNSSSTRSRTSVNRSSSTTKTRTRPTTSSSSTSRSSSSSSSDDDDRSRTTQRTKRRR